MHYTRSLLNVFDPVFMRNIKKTLNKYKESMQQTNMKGVSREAFVDIDEKGPAWYLGHMSLAYKQLESKVKDADFVLEIRDARLPFSTENSHLRKLIVDKPRLIVFNKAELANEDCSRLIQKYYEGNGYYAIFTSAQRSWRDIVEAVERFVVHILPTPKYKTTASIGLVVGMPNVGKSTLINALRLSHEHEFHQDNYHRSRTSETVSIYPGTTRALKLVPLSKDPNIVLFDSPGMTLPGCFAKEAGIKLAACGIVPTNELSLSVASVTRYLFDIFMQAHSGEHLAECLHLPRIPITYDDCIAMICERGRESGLSELGSIWVEIAQKNFLYEFQIGNLGRITLDRLPKRFYSQTIDQSSMMQSPLLLEMQTNRKEEDASTNGQSNYNNYNCESKNNRSRSNTSDSTFDTSLNEDDGINSDTDTNNTEYMYTHEVESNEVVNRYQDHMREVLQTLEGKMHDELKYVKKRKGNCRNSYCNSEQFDKCSREREKKMHFRGKSSTVGVTRGVAADEETVISRKKGPISKTTALDDSLHKHIRLAPGC